MLFWIPASLTGLIIILQLVVPRLRFSGLANMITVIILGSTIGLGLILRAA